MRTETIQLLSIDFIQNKNNITFSKLIKRLKPGLKNYLYKFSKDFDIIEDIIQNTFIRIWEKIDQYDKQYNFSTWVYAIARNEALGQLKLERKQYSVVNAVYESFGNNYSGKQYNNTNKKSVVLSSTYSPFVNMSIECYGPKDEEVVDYLHMKAVELIHEINEPYRRVLMEREIHRKQLSDIAEELGWNLNTVKTRLKKGRNKISQMLNENYCDLINIYNDLK